MNDVALRKSRILIVDDQVANICLLQNFFVRIGYTNIEAITDSTRVFETVARFRPDLIILDLLMPKVDGFQVLHHLKPSRCESEAMPVLVVTGEASVENKRRAFAAGAADILAKPFDLTELVLRVSNLLYSHHLRLASQAQNEILEQRVAGRTAELEQALRELKDAQEQMMRQERLQAFSEMAGGVVHDFNNALMSVIGYSDILLQDSELLKDPEIVREHLNIMNTAGRDAASVLNRLRDFYRSREEGELSGLDLNKLVEELAVLTQPKWKDQALAGGREIRVDLDLEKVPTVSGNSGELRELLRNLIFNSVDAMPEGGVITLRTRRRDGGGASLEVADTGTGMTEVVRARCLEPFFTTKGESGTGLGLAMVFGIIKRHEAKFDIETSPGEGTKFRICFNASDGTVNRTEDQALLVERKLRILVVDDEPVARDVVTRYLTSDGHDVLSATNGVECLALMQQESFDVLITDQGMPRMSGTQLASIAREMAYKQPIILLTGFDEFQIWDNKPSGIDKLLKKPLARVDLRRVIADLF